MNRLIGCAAIAAAVSFSTTAETVKALTAPPGGFAVGNTYEFRLAYPETRKLTFSFETGSKYVEVDGKEKDATVSFTVQTDGTVNTCSGRPRYNAYSASSADATQWSSVPLSPKVPEKTFATLDDVARWQESAARSAKRDPRKEKLRLGVRVDADRYCFFANGVFLDFVARTEADRAGFAFPNGVPVETAVNVTPVDPRFVPVDISEQANARGFGKKITPKPGEMTVVDGVPFLSSSFPTLEAIDLYQSRFECASRAGLSATSTSRRWPDPRAKTPLRFTFAQPADQYDALYVLCATDGSKKNAIPRFTAQFYHWIYWKGFESGRPMSFRSETVPVSTNGALYVVKIPLSGDFSTEFANYRQCAFELTKDVETYRVYPDTYEFSEHAAGLPSAVKVLGVTLHRPELRVSFDPDQRANVFCEGEGKVSYTVTLENATDRTLKEKVAFSTRSWDGTETYEDDDTVKLAPGERREVKFAFRPDRYGWHEINLAAGGRAFRRTAVYLRERDYSRKPFEEPGMRFGAWSTFDTLAAAEICGKIGYFYGQGWTDLDKLDPEMRAVAEKYGYQAFTVPGNKRATSAVNLNDPFETNVVQFLRSFGPANISDPRAKDWKYVVTLAEPGGIGTGYAQFPEYYGEPENAFDYRKLKGAEKERYEGYKKRILAASEGLRRQLPGVKRLTPHGNWVFMVPYLQDPETRHCFEGVQCDFQFFTHLPEEQMYETSIHSLWYFKHAWEKYRPGEKPLLTWGEGPDIFQVYPGASTETVSAAHRVRVSALLAGYGVDWQFSWGTNPISSGEHHCAGGFVSGYMSRNPDWACGTSATWSRLTRDATFESYTDMGSKSAYCENFRDHKTGRLFRAIWTVRGTREFVFPCRPGKLEVYDPMDNVVEAESRDGKAVVTVGQMPYFVFCADDCVPVVGAFDHSDSALAPGAVALGNLADSFGSQTADADSLYLDTMPEYIRRFPATMDVKAVDTERGKALSVGLPPQKIDRMLMPYYTCLKMKKPVAIPGKAEFLRLDVKAASDWGRVVFQIRDAANKVFYSCGRKGTWNADDMEGQSFFNFDGWRTLRIELPSNAPWDGFREKGFSTWGGSNLLDQVTLPLCIEKVFVERRSGVMYGNTYVKLEKEVPVLLGGLYAEYAAEEHKTAAYAKLSNLRAPTFPEGSLPNPIAELEKAGTLAPGKITAVKDPETWFNGTNGEFEFELPKEAVSWDVYLSLYPNGKGALKQAANLRKSPAHVAGFLADTTFYAFVVWRDKAGNASKPSPAFKFKLEDHFANQ